MRASEGHPEPAVRRPGPPARSGFAACLARELVLDRRVDLRAALELLARGCPPELAVRIATAHEQMREAA